MKVGPVVQLLLGCFCFIEEKLPSEPSQAATTTTTSIDFVKETIFYEGT